MSLATKPANRPPFSFSAESEQFERRWLQEIPRRIYALQTQLIPERNILKYHHGAAWTSNNTQGKEIPGEFKQHSEELVVAADARQNAELEKLTDLTDDLARKMAGAAERLLHETVDAVTKETGNVVTWRKKEKNAPAAFLELLRKVQFGVTEKGEPSLPTMMNFDPAFLEELQAYTNANPAYGDEVEAIKTKKIAEARGREAERKGKFKRRI